MRVQDLLTFELSPETDQLLILVILPGCGDLLRF